MSTRATTDIARTEVFPPLYRICMVAFAVDFAAMAGMMAMPFFVYRQLGAGAEMSGLFGAAQGATYTIVCLASSGVVQRASNGLVWALGGLVGYGALMCLAPAFRTPLLCGALFAGANGFLALVWPALHSWVGAHPDPHQRARRMSWFNISWSVGFAISPLIAGPLCDQDYRLPFALLLGLTIVAIALVRSLPADHLAHADDEAEEEVSPESIRRSEAHLLAGWATVVVATGLAGVTRTVFPKRIAELVASHQLRLLSEASPLAMLTTAAATKYSWLAFSMSIASAGTFVVLGRTRRWQHSFAFTLATQTVAAAAFWVLATTRSLVAMLVCFVVVGVNVGLAFFSSIFYCVANPAKKHRRAAINEGAVGAGGLIGNLAFGILVRQYGHAMPYHWTPAVVAIAIAVQAALLQIGRRRVAAR